jgi:hypothetical protein
MMLFDYHQKRKPLRRRRRRAPYEPPRPGVTRASGLQLSDPDFWRERREAEDESEINQPAEQFTSRANKAHVP